MVERRQPAFRVVGLCLEHPPRFLVVAVAIVGTVLVSASRTQAAVSAAARQDSYSESLFRRLGKASTTGCTGQGGFPLHGVQYVPHFVGEPYPAPDSAPASGYESIHHAVHAVDLPLIGRALGADTITLRPWALDRSASHERQKFFKLMVQSGLCQVVPSFHAARYYADMVKASVVEPDSDSRSNLAMDFARFGASVAATGEEGPKVVAWSMDLSLDLGALLPRIPGRECVEPKDDSYIRYMNLASTLMKWVDEPQPGQEASAMARALHELPLLLPLDLSTIPMELPHWEESLKQLFICMRLWNPRIFGSRGATTRWLLSFSVPFTDGPDKYRYEELLAATAGWLRGPAQGRAVVMYGTQALRPDPANVNQLVEDWGTETNQPQQQLQIQAAFRAYLNISSLVGNLDGFIIDEWQDDWDRGARGPWFLAADSVHDMRGDCRRGGRFAQDAKACGKYVAPGWSYPEYYGMASISSQFMRHCSQPRFREGLFTLAVPNAGEGAVHPLVCSRIGADLKCVLSALGVMFGVLLLQFASLCCRWAWRPAAQPEVAGVEEQAHHRHVEEPDKVCIGKAVVVPKEARFRADLTLQLHSRRMQCDEEAAWWLRLHLSAQTTILEKQIRAEVDAQRAVKARQLFRKGILSDADGTEGMQTESTGDSLSEHSNVGSGDDLRAAMCTIHKRVLEGVVAWCDYLARNPCARRGGIGRLELREVIELVEENGTRPLPVLFLEALLLRVMECLSEQVISCPERLAFLYFRTLTGAPKLASPLRQGLARRLEAVEANELMHIIDLDALHDGLAQMQQWSNPYKTALVDGHRSLGLNFDDVNESGVQCRGRVGKTFREPVSIMVVVNYVLSYRTVIVVKVWTVMLAIYIYIGSSRSADFMTNNNGSLLNPEWLRVNMILYGTLADAGFWVVLELVLILHTTWQRWPSLGYRAPGVPGLCWYLEHFLNIVFSTCSAVLLWNSPLNHHVHPIAMEKKPWMCEEQLENPSCVDPRVATLERKLRTLGPAAVYMLLRLLVFCLLHRPTVPALIKGTPWRSARRVGPSRGLQRLFVQCAWVAMLGICVLLEVLVFLPAVRGLSLSSLCGLSLGRFDITGAAPETGVCTKEGRLASFNCVSCILSVVLALLLTTLTCFLDMYFVFYLFSSLWGSFFGFVRHLNNLKNVSVPVNLKPKEGNHPEGNEAALFQKVFGPGWQEVWRMMVRGLQEEAYVSPHMAAGLIQAAGVPPDGYTLLTRPERKKKPINLSQFPQLAGERLAFFFQSLEQLQNPRLSGAKMNFFSETDALTGEHFDPGSIPSLTMIIPAYNETVVQSTEYLRAGSKKEDATNQNPDGQPGVGDLTNPPLGDGINTNLAFLISQFPDEWQFLAKHLHSLGRIGSSDTLALYRDFMAGSLSLHLENEVRLWASNRTQTVAKTVIGALQYSKALASLPAIQEYYRQFPEKRAPEDHAEVILCHQTYGLLDGNPENDASVQLLLQRHANEPLYLVFDLNPRSSPEMWALVESFLQDRGDYHGGSFKYASVKCSWSNVQRSLQVMEVLPRKFPLRLGHGGGYYTQGKACNQLNGLRFANGHILQALDCNMGVFIGEGFKVPYVLRNFMPLDRADRVTPRCRFLGFREYIFTSREGTVGKCHASAEWTFGTIYQRFLSAMGTRMHYGHPDFVDAFFARNRGGMSKASPVVNLSEDIFAGYNVLMRNEACPHVDQLEFEKGREASFNAASNFFAKISGGSVAVVRSRDNQLLCEKMGILPSFSFYFTSVAFYVSNLLIDMSIYTYVFLFIALTLADVDLARLNKMGSYFATEWFVSIGLVSLLPQVFEMILEHGAVHAVKTVLRLLPGASIFFIFQNKSLASEVRIGCSTGLARYIFSGRPLANQHLTWKDSYCTYWKSHFSPALLLMLAYCTYQILSFQTSHGRLPIALAVASFAAWIVAPVLFNPYPRWCLIEQDFRDFGCFITARAGMEEEELSEVMKRGSQGNARTLFELGLHDEISYWAERQVFTLLIFVACRGCICLLLALVLPAEILGYMYIFLVVTAIQWVTFLVYLHVKMVNILMSVSLAFWLLALFLGHWVIGKRANSPSFWARLTEYLLSFVVYICTVQFVKGVFLLACRLLHLMWPCAEERAAGEKLRRAIRLCYVYFFVHQMHLLQALAVLLANLTVSGVLALIDWAFCGAHTWWLLNSELARTKHGAKYLAQQPTFLQQDRERTGSASTAAASEEGSPLASDEHGDGRAARHGEVMVRQEAEAQQEAILAL